MRTQHIESDKDLATLEIWENFDSSLTPVCFVGGNGFPVGTYRQMLAELARTRTVYAMEHRATWLTTSIVAPPSKSFTWASAAKDLIHTLDVLNTHRHNGQKYIGVGHSLGGVMTLLAAAHRPDLFDKIILIEPVLFPYRWILALNSIPLSLRGKYLPMAKRTLRRRALWDSHEAFVNYHLAKSAYHGISADVMNDYAQSGLKKTTQQQWELRFPARWEAHIFSTISNPWGAINMLPIPAVFARAAQSQWIPERAWNKLQKLRPDLPIQVLPDMGHLAPLQEPVTVAQFIQAQF